MNKVKQILIDFFQICWNALQKFGKLLCEHRISVITGLLIVILTAALPVCNIVQFKCFNQSLCSVWVEGDKVYNGFCHFIKIVPVGSSSKKVIIYEDSAKMRIQQIYLAETVEILREVNEIDVEDD